MLSLKQRLIKSVNSWPRRAGRKELLAHLNGERLTRDEAIRAKCYECVGGEETGPCYVAGCALSQYCPRNRKGSTGGPEDSANREL